MRIGSETGGMGRTPLVLDQPEGGYRYTLDPFLLASFVKLGRGERVIDLGSGVGVIGLVLASIYPDVHITGIEIQGGLHEASLKNIVGSGSIERVESRLGDFRSIGNYFRPSSFTAAVSNPPYYTANRCRISRDRGVAVAKHGIKGGIGEVIDASSIVLIEGGSLSLIFPAEKFSGLEALLNDRGFSIKRARFVKSKEHLKAKAVMLEAVLGTATQTEVAQPLIVHDGEGGYTDEVSGIFERIGARSF